VEIEKSFCRQLAHYSPRIDYFLKTLGISCPEDREDLVQDILEKTFRAKKAYNPSYAFSTWIYTIARRTAIDFLRKNRAVREPFEGDYSTSVLNSEDLLLCNEQREFIHDFITGLDSVDRQMTYLRYFENLPLKKIAVVLDIPLGTVKYRLFEIRRHLKEAWQDYENKS
jgi:RNA polymerase sigma-70 factor (ECF subfamily)